MAHHPPAAAGLEHRPSAGLFLGFHADLLARRRAPGEAPEVVAANDRGGTETELRSFRHAARLLRRLRVLGPALTDDQRHTLGIRRSGTRWHIIDVDPR